MGAKVGTAEPELKVLPVGKTPSGLGGRQLKLILPCQSMGGRIELHATFPAKGLGNEICEPNMTIAQGIGHASQTVCARVARHVPKSISGCAGPNLDIENVKPFVTFAYTCNKIATR